MIDCKRINKRVWQLHDGDWMIKEPIKNYLDKNGCLQINDNEKHCWWEEIGCFETKAMALKYREKHNLQMLHIHSMSINVQWLYDIVLANDMVKDRKEE